MIDKALIPKKTEAFDVFTVMDRLDDAQIEAEIKGEVVSTWVYEFEQEGRAIRGLSKKGTDAAVDLLAKRGEVIREKLIAIERTPEAYEFVVVAQKFLLSKDGTQEVLLQESLGFKRQPLTMKKKDGTIIDDPFFFEKGGIKAARNAKRRLLGPAIEELIIAEAVKGRKVKQIKTPASEAEAPAMYEEETSLLTTCPIHNEPWAIRTSKTGKYPPFRSHNLPIGSDKPYCNFSEVMKGDAEASAKALGGTWAAVEERIKTKYNSTWSKLTDEQKVEVVMGLRDLVAAKQQPKAEAEVAEPEAPDEPEDWRDHDTEY